MPIQLSSDSYLCQNTFPILLDQKLSAVNLSNNTKTESGGAPTSNIQIVKNCYLNNKNLHTINSIKSLNYKVIFLKIFIHTTNVEKFQYPPFKINF